MKITTVIDMVLLIFMMCIGVFMASLCMHETDRHRKAQIIKDKSLIVEFGENQTEEFKYNTADLTLMLLIQDSGIPSTGMHLQVNSNPPVTLDTDWQVNRLVRTRAVYQSQILPYGSKKLTDFTPYYDSSGEFTWKAQLD